MNKTARHIEELAGYFRGVGGEVRVGTREEVMALLGKLEAERKPVAEQMLRNLERVPEPILLVAATGIGGVARVPTGAALAYFDEGCIWVADIVTESRGRGTGTALMRELARRAQDEGRELRCEARAMSLGFFDTLGARVFDRYNRRVLVWKESALEDLAGAKEKEVEALST